MTQASWHRGKPSDTHALDEAEKCLADAMRVLRHVERCLPPGRPRGVADLAYENLIERIHEARLWAATLRCELYNEHAELPRLFPNQVGRLNHSPDPGEEE